MQTQSSLYRTPHTKLFHLLLVIGVCVSWVSSSPAQGDVSGERPILVDFEYHAEAECPGEEHAFSLVHRRSRRVVRARGRDAGQQLSMAVSRSGSVYRGVLSVVRAGGDEERRSMTGESCDEVVEALALTAALSIDPNATLTLGPVDPPKPAESDSRSRDDPPERQEPKPPPGPARTRVVLGSFFHVSSLMSGATHLGGGASLGLSRLDRRAFLPLELRVSLLGLGDVSGAPEPKIVTSFFLSRLSYCALRLGTNAALLLCPAVDVGAVFARARGFEQDTRNARFMAALGGEVWLRTRVGDSADIWLSPSLMAPVTERAYGVDPGPEVLTSTVNVSWGVSFGFGWVF